MCGGLTETSILFWKSAMSAVCTRFVGIKTRWSLKEVGEEIAQGNGCEVVTIGKSERGRGQRTCVIPVHGPLGNAPGSRDMEQGRPVVVSICC